MSLGDELNRIGDLYEGQPDPPQDPVPDETQAEYDVMSVRDSGVGKDEQRSSITRRETRHGDRRR